MNYSIEKVHNTVGQSNPSKDLLARPTIVMYYTLSGDVTFLVTATSSQLVRTTEQSSIKSPDDWIFV